jgi:hypothetical protein
VRFIVTFGELFTGLLSQGGAEPTRECAEKTNYHNGFGQKAVGYPPYQNGFAQKVNPTPTEAVKNCKSIEDTTQEPEIRRWEGGLAPAQDRMPLSLDLRIQGQAVWEMGEVNLLTRKFA